MPEGTESESRKLLRRLRDLMAEEAAGQERLDKITHLTADSMKTEVCSVYLFRDSDTLELCATEGLKPESVHQTRMRLGEGLVGRVARSGEVVTLTSEDLNFRYRQSDVPEGMILTSATLRGGEGAPDELAARMDRQIRLEAGQLVAL